MIITQKQTVWLLKHNTNKYIKVTCNPSSITDCVTDDPLDAMRFHSKEQAVLMIEMAKVNTKTARWPAERANMFSMAESTPVRMTITTEAVIDDELETEYDEDYL